MKVVLLSELKEGINKNPNLQYVHSILFELIDKLPTIDLEEIAERLLKPYLKLSRQNTNWVKDDGEKIHNKAFALGCVRIIADFLAEVKK